MDEDSIDGRQPRKMVEVLLQHVLPYIQSQYSNTVTQPPFQVADLAASFTLLALEQPNFQTQSFDQLFGYFVTSEKVNIRLMKRYLSLVLLEDAVMRIVIDPSKNYESSVIQAWVRYGNIYSSVLFSGDAFRLSWFVKNHFKHIF